MFLAVDIGNTNITFGIFDQNKVIKTFRSDVNSSDFESNIKKETEYFCIRKCGIISVVNDLDKKLKTVVDELYNIDAKILLQDSDAGADRIANVKGACQLYKKRPIIVVDSGSAITFDIADKNGDFIRGPIMPGLKMQLKALNTGTSKLPEIEPDEINNVLVYNTKDAILGGVIRASACAAEGLISECEKELGERALLIGTGGYINYLSKYLKRKFDIINPNLTLIGIKEVYRNI